jgi:hypothetical protein
MFTLLGQASHTPVDTELVKWVIVAISAILAVGLIGLTIVSYVSFSRDNVVASENLNRFFGAGSALNLLTVLAVILSATVLALAGKLENGAATLLSGIAGYVLGALSTSARATSPKATATTAIGGTTKTQPTGPAF